MNNDNNTPELDVNKKNREEFEGLMENSKTKYDMYYDKNNVMVKIILFLLLLFIICGVAYYALLFFSKR